MNIAEYGFDVWGLSPPFEEQRRFLLSQKKNILWVSGRGVGKTSMSVLKILLMAMEPRHAGAALGLFGPTYRSITRVQCAMLHSYLRSFQEKTGFSLLRRFYKSELIFEMISGSYIYAQSFSRLDRVRGYSLAAAVIDECETAPDPVYAHGIIAATIRSSGTNHSGQLVCTTTPRGMRGVVAQYIHKVREKDENFQVITCPTSANPYISPDFVDRLRATLSKTMFAQEVEGKILRPQAQIFSSFRRALHVVPFRYSDEPYSVAIDWGYSHPYFCLIAHLSGDGEPDRDVCFWEFCEDDVPEGTLIQMIRKKCNEIGRDPEMLVADRAIPRQNSALMRQFRHSRTRTMVSAQEQQVWRGIEVLRARLSPADDGPPRLFFSDELVTENERGIIRGIEGLRRIHKDGAPIDQPYKDNKTDHSTDALRMFCVARYKNQASAFTVGAEAPVYADRKIKRGRR